MWLTLKPCTVYNPGRIKGYINVIHRLRFAQNGNNEIAPLSGAQYKLWHTPKGDKGLGLSEHLLEPQI